MPRQSVHLWLMELPNSTNREQRGKKRKRYPLAERYPNAMNQLPARTPSPLKRRKRQDTDLRGNDTENTPRPFNPTVLLSLRDDASQHLTSSARSSATSPRSRSPTKQMSEMLFAPQPILFKQFVPRGPVELPSDLNTILHTIERRFLRGIAVVSDAYQVWSKALLPYSYV